MEGAGLQVPGAQRPGWGDLSASARDPFPKLVVAGRRGRGCRSQDGCCVLVEVKTEVAEEWLGFVGRMSPRNVTPDVTQKWEERGRWGGERAGIWMRDGVSGGSISSA